MQRAISSLAILIAIAGVAMLLPVVILPAAGKAQTAQVYFAAAPDLRSLPKGVAILEWSAGGASLTGVDAAAARALYRLGALIVYPVRAGGCLGLRKQDGRTVGATVRPLSSVGQGHPRLAARSSSVSENGGTPQA